MVTHAANLLSRFGVGHDGKTPYERLRGKKYEGQLPEFAETVWRHFPTKNVKKDDRGKLRVRWGKAIFLGMVPMSTEVYLWDGARVVKARGIRRTNEQDRWDKAAVEGVTQHPWTSHSEARQAPRVIFEEKELEQRGEPEPAPRPAAKGLYVKKAYLEEHGYTEGCRQCTAMRAGVPCTTGHSQACRERIMRALGEDDPRVRRVVERIAREGRQYCAGRPNRVQEKNSTRGRTRRGTRRR